MQGSKSRKEGSSRVDSERFSGLVSSALLASSAKRSEKIQFQQVSSQLRMERSPVEVDRARAPSLFGNLGARSRLHRHPPRLKSIELSFPGIAYVPNYTESQRIQKLSYRGELSENREPNAPRLRPEGSGKRSPT